MVFMFPHFGLSAVRRRRRLLSVCQLADVRRDRRRPRQARILAPLPSFRSRRRGISDPRRSGKPNGSRDRAAANFRPLCCQPSKSRKGRTGEGLLCRLRGPACRCCMSPPVREMVAVPQEDTIAFIEPILISFPSVHLQPLHSSIQAYIQ